MKRIEGFFLRYEFCVHAKVLSKIVCKICSCVFVLEDNVIRKYSMSETLLHPLALDYVGFQITNKIVLGFGLDYRGYESNLKEICQLA